VLKQRNSNTKCFCYRHIIDTSYLKQIGRKIDSNNIVASQHVDLWLITPLIVKFTVSLTKSPVWLLEESDEVTVLEKSDEVTVSLCNLRNTELIATFAVLFRTTQAMHVYHNIESHSTNSITYSELVSVFLP
jgi:hypothetical protein